MRRDYAGPQLDLFAAAGARLLALDQARADAAVGIQRAARRAERKEPTFSEQVASYFEARLAAGPATGEDLVDAAKAAGFRGSGDDRCFGRAFKLLLERGARVLDSSQPRRKGHGSSGGRLWAGKDWKA